MRRDRDLPPEPDALRPDDWPLESVIQPEPDILFSRGYRGASIRARRAPEVPAEGGERRAGTVAAGEHHSMPDVLREIPPDQR